ncbi:MAG TPA: glycerol-3-phosphate dehydrogenase, partial [Acidisoma sp.]|nr:glycerol-3-phosphate dehydrogenase [Acidisoma sp.]
CLADLGKNLGADLTEAELTYLVAHEWVRSAQDILWRRSKLGLRVTQEQAAQIDEAIGRQRPRVAAAA